MWTEHSSFSQHVDCICIHNGGIIAGLSDLEGNVWGGSLCMVNDNGEQVAHSSQDHGVSALAVHGNDSALSVVVAGNDIGDLKLFSSSNLELYRNIPAHDSIVSAIVSCGGQGETRVVSGGWDGFIKVWDFSKPENHALQSIQAHSNAIHSLAANRAQPHLLLSTSFDGFACVWDLRQREGDNCVQSITYRGQIPSAAAWHPEDPFQFAAGFVDGSICLYDVRRPSSALAYNKVSSCRVNKIAWLGDVVVLCAGQEMALGHLHNDTLSSKRYGGHHTDYIRDFAILNTEPPPSRTRIFTASMDCSIGVFDVAFSELKSTH